MWRTMFRVLEMALAAIFSSSNASADTMQAAATDGDGSPTFGRAAVFYLWNYPSCQLPKLASRIAPDLPIARPFDVCWLVSTCLTVESNCH